MNKLYEAIGAGLIAATLTATPSHAGEELAGKVANITLEFSNVKHRQVGARNYYDHTRTFRETNGIGVNLTRGELCFDIAPDCVTGKVDYRIEGNGTLIRDDNFWGTNYFETFYLKYWGKDDNGNDVIAEQSLSTPLKN